MKTNLLDTIGGLAFASALILSLQPSTLCAQGTAFTYQGRLESGGAPASGLYDLRFAIYDSSSGGTLVAGPLTNAATAVSNGLFAVTLDFGAGVFGGSARWLEIGVRPNGAGPFNTLSPRQAVRATPYAILSGNVSGVIANGSLPVNPVFSGTVSATGFSGNGAGLTSLNASQLTSGTLPDARLAANVARTNQVWLSGGNAGTTPGTHFLGTTDNQPLELRVNNQRALRLQPHPTSPNLIGGYAGNYIAAGVYGSTIGGGGETGYPNAISALYATIGGGGANTIQPNANDATIGGGWGSAIQTNAGRATIGGGGGNTIQTDAAAATIAGGWYNTIQTNAQYATIGGGRENTILANDFSATIGGGWANTIHADFGTIGGGRNNTIQADAYSATLGGGYQNTIQPNADYATLGGGRNNTIQPNADYATLGGGYQNTIQTNADYATIGGGYSNTIQTNADSATIGGGYFNRIQDAAENATISGGTSNTIQTDADSATIGGGGWNTIEPFAYSATIGGGTNNIIQGGAFFATIGGGGANTIQPNSWSATIGGGYSNRIQYAAYNATISGGTKNTIQTDAESATIGGGDHNTIQNIAWSATIGGGGDNTIQALAGYATIGGGGANTIQTDAGLATIGGGSQNTIQPNGDYATIPGGLLNSATNYAFAAGNRAKANHTGSFVWGDSTSADIASAAANSVTFRASGGYRLFSDSGASTGVYLSPGSGSWMSLCDRNAKENFRPVNTLEVLNKVAALPLNTWNYKSQNASIRHLGPTAQDFRAAFGLGESETGITGVDADGVALAAIQGLNRKLESRSQEAEGRIQKLEAENAALKAELERLIRQMSTLAVRLNGGAL